MQVWVVVPDHLEVAAEKSVVADIEADDGCIEADICFRELGSEDELVCLFSDVSVVGTKSVSYWSFAFTKNSLHPIKVLEEDFDVFVVRRLGCCKTRLVKCQCSQLNCC